MRERTVFISLFALLAGITGWLLYDKYSGKDKKFTDKQTAMNYLYLIGKGDPEIMKQMDDVYIIARANAIHDGLMTFAVNGKSYNTATGYGS